jgi:hypothetical protein
VRFDIVGSNPGPSVERYVSDYKGAETGKTVRRTYGVANDEIGVFIRVNTGDRKEANGSNCRYINMLLGARRVNTGGKKILTGGDGGIRTLDTPLGRITV